MWAWIAHDLRLYRMRHKMTQEDLGRVLRCVKSTVSRLESGQLQLDEKQAAKLDSLWNTHGHFTRLLVYAHRAHNPNWMRQHAESESRAAEIKSFETCLVPGLLQTPEYTRELFRTTLGIDDVERHVEERMRRQDILDRADPPTLWFLLDESVIDRSTSDPEVMRKQLARLLEESHRPNISIRVRPRAAGLHAGLGGSFKIFFHELGDVAYSEAQFGGRLVVSASEVRGLVVQYERIGAHALPENQSRELIKRYLEASK
ncbi:helix-turn-helix domain-containing protein [Actinoallomurus iriomotensis]|nr:helix-turn-helix transcriptional regulator [Actinoallomurus iriomotensis]